MVRRELGLNKIRAVITTLKPELKIYAGKSKCEISCQWKPMVRLVPQPGDLPPVLSFATENITNFGISMQDLRSKLAAAFEAENAVQWSV